MLNPTQPNLEASPRELYLELLIKILANTIYGDPSVNPQNAGPFRSELRLEGRDWPAQAHTMIGVRRLENVRELAQRAIDEKIPGDFAEAGVWRGGCCILMRGILAANGIRDRKVYAVDSFAGLPPPNPHEFPQDEGLNLHLYPELAVSLEEVKANFERYGLLDEQVVFVRGLFQDTLPLLDAERFALIRLDADLYESTTAALEALYPKLSPGGFLILDDYKFLKSVREAADDYRARMGIESPIHEIDWNSVWWQKPKTASLSPAKRAVFRAITLLPLLTLLSVVLYLLFLTNMPQLLYAQSIRNVYFDCMQFVDDEYLYKMKPGRCDQKNIEHHVIYTHDRNGFRNINAAPDYDLAVIGDSQAHGVGVQDYETFASILEGKYNLPTINLGIGSYATLREMEVLANYGNSAKYVILQYCDNDFGENEAAVRLSRADFKVQAEKEWGKIIQTYYDGKAKGLMKPVRDLAVMLKTHSYMSKSAWHKEIKDRPMDREAYLIAQILGKYRPILEGKRLIIFEVADYGNNSPNFAATVGAELNKLGWLRFKVIDSSTVLNFDDYFFLDNHINTSGHKKLADRIAAEISKWESAEPFIDRQ